MEQEKLVQGWMVCGTDEEAQKPEMYFLDVNNAIAYREMQRDAASLTIRLQYIRPEWAKDLHKSRLRQRDGKQECALPGFVDSKNEEKTERNAGYLVVSQSGGGMLRQGTRKGIRRTPANRGMRAHRIVKSLDISEDVCHGMCP